MKIRIANNGICLNMNRKRLFPGDVVEIVDDRKENKYGDREIKRSTAESWLKSGHAVTCSENEIPQPNENAVNAPSAENPIPGVTTPETGVGVGSNGNVSPLAGRVNSPMSRFNLDPALLRDKSVEELNAMIGERLDDNERADFVPYGSEDLNLAIAHLTRDFESQGGEETVPEDSGSGSTNAPPPPPAPPGGVPAAQGS